MYAARGEQIHTVTSVESLRCNWSRLRFVVPLHAWCRLALQTMIFPSCLTPVSGQILAASSSCSERMQWGRTEGLLHLLWIVDT